METYNYQEVLSYYILLLLNFAGQSAKHEAIATPPEPRPQEPHPISPDPKATAGSPGACSIAPRAGFSAVYKDSLVPKRLPKHTFKVVLEQVAYFKMVEKKE